MSKEKKEIFVEPPSEEIAAWIEREQDTMDSVGVEYMYARLLAKSEGDDRFTVFDDGSIAYNHFMALTRGGRVVYCEGDVARLYRKDSLCVV